MNKLVELLNGYTAILFQTQLPPHARQYYEREVKAGDTQAQYYLEYLDAKDAKDYQKLAEFIPDNWFELYADDYQVLLPDYRREFLDTMALTVLGKKSIEGKEDEEELYQSLAREFNKTSKEIKLANLQTIEGIARTKFFISLYGSALPIDEKGSPMLPSPMMAKLLGISGDEADTLIMEYLPLSFDHHSTLSKISSVLFFKHLANDSQIQTNKDIPAYNS